jgi:O-antigen/teichoic acid export membrane protein
VRARAWGGGSGRGDVLLCQEPFSPPPDLAAGRMTVEVAESYPVPVPVAPAGRDRRLVVIGGLWSAASQLVPAAGTAVLSVVAARKLGSDALGRQSVIAYVNMAVAAILVASLGTAVLQQMGELRGAGNLVGVVTLGGWFRRAALLLGFAAGVLMIGIGLVGGNDRLAWSVVGVVAIADAAADGLAARMLLEDGFSAVSRLRLVFQTLGPPLGILGITLGLGIAGIFVGDGIAALGLWFALARRQRRRRRAGQPSGGGEVLRVQPPVHLGRRYGLFALNETVTQIVAKRIEFVVLAALSTTHEIAMYSVAFISVSLVSLVPGGVAAAALPLIAGARGGGRADGATRHLRYAVRLGSLLSVPLAALVAALGPSLVTLVYGHQYDEAARLVPFAAAALLLPVAVAVCNQWWVGNGQLSVVLRVGLVAALVDVGTAALLAGALGARGAVAASLLGQATLAGGLLRLTSRRTGRFGWRLRGLLLTAVVSAVAGGTAATFVVLLQRALGGGVVTQLVALVAAGIEGVVVVLVGCCIVKVLEPVEALWLKPLVPARLTPLLRCLTHETSNGAAPKPDERCGN